MLSLEFYYPSLLYIVSSFCLILTVIYLIPFGKQLSMKFHSTSVASFLFVTIILFPLAIADLSSDKQALLDFANALLHRQNLMWNPSTSVCTSWVGITCNDNRTRVVKVRLNTSSTIP